MRQYRRGKFFLYIGISFLCIGYFLVAVPHVNAQTATPTPTVDFCTEFPSDPTCLTPTPPDPTASPTATMVFPTPVYIDIATNSAVAKGIHDIILLEFNEFLIIGLGIGFILGAMFFFLS